jgi:hypothetical protein
MAPNREVYLQIVAGMEISQNIPDSCQVLVFDPVGNEAVRREQAQTVAFNNRLERQYPRVELLYRKFALKAFKALFPKGNSHLLCLRSG